MKILPTVCALDCPDSCSLHITVDEQNRVHRLEGNPDHPITQGFACAKMYRYPERQEHADRLLYPQKRIGPKGEGKFVRISWDEALAEIADRLQTILSKHGAQSVLPYSYCGTMGVIESQHPLAFFRALGALELEWTICASTGSAGWEANYGPNKYGPDPEDIVHSRFILLWGINALRSNSHSAPWLKEARRRGARIVHIDPFRNETSRFSDEHCQIRVGTDAALALALGGEILKQNWCDQEYLDRYAVGLDDYRQQCLQWPLDRAAEYCGLQPEWIANLAKEYATASSSYIKVGYGLTRNEGGGNAMRAITLLPALTGAWKKPGGGATLSTSGAFRLNHGINSGSDFRKQGVRNVNMNQLGSELNRIDDPIQAMFVFNSNPAAVAPDTRRVVEGLKREDLFTVVLEHFQTDTADYADFLLPATTFLEHHDLYTSYGHYFLQWAEPIIPARGEARSNRWFFSELAKRLQLQVPSLHWSPEELARSLVASDHPHLAGITFEQLQQQRSVKLNLPSPFRPYSDGSNFSDRKIRFGGVRQIAFEEQTTDEFPLRLISPPGPFILNTSMGNLESIRKSAGGEPQVILHPSDAQTYGVADQTHIKITSLVGSIVRKAVVSTDARQGVVVALGQWWPKFAPDRKSLNELTSERLTDLGGGSTFGNPIVKIEPLAKSLVSSEDLETQLTPH